MESPLYNIAVLHLFAAALWGWGWAAARIMHDPGQTGWLYPVALGLAVTAVAGGVVNSAGIAYPGVLWGILGTGWMLAALNMPQSRLDKADIPWLLVIGTVSLVILGFLAATLMPSSSLNFHDDFHTYLQRPVRMLLTGSLDGGWFDLLGVDSLGGHAFFQGFLLLVFPLNYINGFDGVFCTALAVALAGELARRLGVHILLGVVAMATLILINPQTVNVSTLYAGTVAIQGLLLAILSWCEMMEKQAEQVPWGPAIASGLFLVLIVALKTTLALFAAVFLVFWLTGALVLFRNKKAVLLSALGVIASATVAIIPWLILHGSKLLAATTLFFSSRTAGFGDSSRSVDLAALLSDKELFYGGGYLDYASLVAGLLVAAIIAMILLWLRRGQNRDAYLAPVFAASMATVVTYLLNPYLTDLQTAIRYSIPVILATAPFVIAAAGRCHRKTAEGYWYISNLSVPGVTAGIVILLATTIAFGGALKNRVVRITGQNTLVSFPVNRNYERYCRNAFDKLARDSVRRIQSVTLPGTGILPWISQPYHLDFARNHVLAASEPALLAPWLDLPLNEDTGAIRDFLLDRGTRYIIWEKSGFGVRPPRQYRSMQMAPDPVHRKLGQKSISLLEKLTELSRKYPVIYDSQSTIVIDLDANDDARHGKGDSSRQ